MYHNNNRYYDIFNSEGLLGKMKHVENVIRTAVAIATFQHANVDIELLKVLAEHHDDGRVDQYRILHKFWDSEVTHNSLGVDRLDRFINSNDGLEIDDEIQLLRNAMLYHGRLKLAYGLSELSTKYIELLTAADDFENATSCVSYLVREVENDEKGYNANLGYNQRELSPENAIYILDCFRSGEKFDKMKVCRTYADYIAFAGTLATSCIKKYGDIAKVALLQPGYGFNTIMEGFKYTFEETLDHVLAAELYRILCEMIK